MSKRWIVDLKAVTGRREVTPEPEDEVRNGCSFGRALGRELADLRKWVAKLDSRLWAIVIGVAGGALCSLITMFIVLRNGGVR